MFKILLPLLFGSALFAQNISPTTSKVAVKKPFVLKSSQEVFDNTLFYTHKPLLSCQPKLNAVYKIESASKLKVLPTTPLRSDQNYACSYKGEAFSFQTVPLKIKEALYFNYDKILRLSFNDKIDAKSISKGISVHKINKLTDTNLHYAIVANDGHNILLKIKEKVGNSTIKLEVNSNLMTQHGTALATTYAKRFNVGAKPLELDANKKKLEINDKPRMVALKDGSFAMRLFLEDNLEQKMGNFIEIKGIEDIQLSSYNYINYTMRQTFSLSDDAYYYHDVTSDEFKPNSTYQITLKKGLTLYSRELKKDLHYTLITPNRAKTIFFDKKKNYISSHGELAFRSVNIEDATLVVERILDDNLRYFMNFNNGATYNINDFTKEVFSKKVTLDAKQNEIVLQKFKLSDLSNKELTSGVYKISLHYLTNEEDEDEQEQVSSKILFISDIGISANLSKDQAFVSLLSLSDAKPIANAEVLLYGKNNALLGKATSDGAGIAIINNKNILKQNPKGIVVKTKNDKNFLLLNQSISSPEPQEILRKKERFNAHIYFQSNILRPMAKLHSLITLKDGDFISAKKIPVKIVLRDPKNKIIHQKVYHTDAYGLIDFNYQFDRGDKLGNYRLNVQLGDHTLASKRLKVEAFMPPKIENQIKTSKNLYHVGELIEANISSSYLFGAPSAGLQGKVTLDARPVEYANKAYRDYHFSNRYLKEENVQSYIEHSEDIVLDNQGKFEIALLTNLHQKVPSTLEAMIGVTIMDDAQPVSTYKKVKLYPYKSMVGVKIERDSFEKGQKLEGSAVLIDPITGKKIQRELTAVIKHIHWHYDYRNGNYHWEKETTIEDTFTIKANEKFSRTILSNGDHYIEIYDHVDGHSTSASFDVWWWSYSNISPSHDLTSLEIKFKDKRYQKGDTLDVTIKSPILEGQLLVTLESDKVESYKLVTLHKGTAKVSLTINKEMRRGLYLHATAYRASDSPSKLIPFRAMGYKFVKPNREAHRIKIEMDLPKVSASKRSFTLKLKTSQPAKVLVSVVDRGILQLVNQKKPAMFKYFNQPQNKEVAYFDLYNQLLAYLTKGKLIDFGAGDALSKKRKHLAPDLGKRIKPFMIWSGLVETKDGVANIKLDIPEFNGRASVVAIAINGDSVGVVNQDIQIKDDVMLKPSYPKFALNGDKIEVPLRLFNTTKSAKEITLSVKNSNNLALKLKETKFSVPPKGSLKTTLTLYPFAEGKGEITLMAHYAQNGTTKSISKSVELPILSPYGLSTKTFKGISTKKITFKAPKAYRDSAVYVTLSNNLIGALHNDLKYLIQYPYGCAEQTSSKLSAMHYAKPFLTKKGLLRESKHFILEGIKKLDSMQNYYGEFYYWQGGRHVHAYASLYAAQTLLELQRDHATIRKDFEEKIVKMLTSVASKNGRYDGSYGEFYQLYAAFILAEHGKLSASIANMLYEKKSYQHNTLSTLYMAAILKMQQETQKANDLYHSVHKTLESYLSDDYRNNYAYLGSNVRDMMIHFTIKSKYFDKDVKDLETIQKSFEKLYSTQSKAVALKAISSYLGNPTNSRINVALQLNGKTTHYTKPTVVSVEKLKGLDVTLEPQTNAVAYTVEFAKNLPKTLKNALSDEKLSIERSFIDDEGEEIDLTNLKQGDKFYSKITLQNYGKLDNVVVSQRIPACFTIVNNNIKGVASRFKDEHINIEHKEIRDDRTLHFVNLPKKEKYDNSRKRYIVQAMQGTFYTPLIATSIGECKLPAIITEAMYDSRINDYAQQTTNVIVKPLSNKKPKKALVAPIKTIPFKLRAKALVEELYTLEMSSQKATDFLKFYHYPLKKYFGKTDVSKNKILKDRTNYFHQFEKRTYTNLKTTILSSDENQTVVKIQFDYKIDNGKKATTGTSRHKLTLIEVDGQPRISEIVLDKVKPKKSKQTKSGKVPFSGKALALVTDFYTKETNSNNAHDFIDFFHYPVTTYFKKSNLSQADILKDKEGYFKSWENRTYTNITTTLLSSNTKEAKVKISFNYEINNGKKTLKGVSQHLLTIINLNGKAKISEVKLYK